VNIVAGKFYKTRDARMVRIYCTDGGGEYPVHGALLGGADWVVRTWTLKGERQKHKADHMDIISAWAEKPVVNWGAMPAWVNYVAMDECGEWLGYSTEPTLHEWHWADVESFSIHEDYYPEYTGPWKDSLMERPQA